MPEPLAQADLLALEKREAKEDRLSFEFRVQGMRRSE